jgi:Na+-translocating ferredoxin:NAD+ oxidoreductase subunit B
VIKLRKRDHMERPLTDDSVYKKLALVLDTLPNGFPSTESGVEIKLLKKIFTPEQAEMFCELKLTMETADEISLRTGRDPLQTRDILETMREDGQVFSVKFGEIRWYKMMPWVFGIFEFQNDRMDREMAILFDEYEPFFEESFTAYTPQLMQVLPVEEEIRGVHEALPFEKISALIEQSQSFRVMDCVCKKKMMLTGHACDRSMQVCMAMAPIPDAFEDYGSGRILTRQQAYELLKETEDLALVHLTFNMQHGRIFICNCCSCCCGVLLSINRFSVPAAQVVNSMYFADIDADACTGCGICASERCQVKAIVPGDAYGVIKERCIGCGLCISTCPASAVKLVRKSESEIAVPPLTENEWFEKRGNNRGIDFSDYK